MDKVSLLLKAEMACERSAQKTFCIRGENIENAIFRI